MYGRIARASAVLAAVALLSFAFVLGARLDDASRLRVRPPDTSIPYPATSPVDNSIQQSNAEPSKGEAVRNVQVITAFVNAYNEGRLQNALDLFTVDASVSDCTYRPVSVVRFQGREQIRQWLQERIADQDHLVIDQVHNASGDPRGLGVSWRTRSSKTLTELGFRDGIRPQLGAKVAFPDSHDRIQRFVNGPVGGSLSSCQPGPVAGLRTVSWASQLGNWR
jgi:hypothetical protein